MSLSRCVTDFVHTVAQKANMDAQQDLELTFFT